MKITVLSANQSVVKGIKTGKGQSLFIQVENHNFLFDFGADKTFLKNMQTLGISPELVDTAFLSCGNAEHGGGLLPFLTENRRAVIYARVNAFDGHYKKTFFGMKEITPDKKLHTKRRILRCKNYFISKDNRFVTFSLTDSAQTPSPANAAYFVKDKEGNFIPDDFSHEMYLLVRLDKRWALFCGDAHAGVVRIVEQAQKLIQRNLGGSLFCVIGGFNLPQNKGMPPLDEYIDGVAAALSGVDVTYYTGHSTSEYAFNRLKSVLGDKLHAYAVGDVIEV